MIRRLRLHDRPVLTPVFYGASTASVGIVSYMAAFILTESVRDAVLFSLFMNVLMLAYFALCIPEDEGAENGKSGGCEPAHRADEELGEQTCHPVR